MTVETWAGPTKPSILIAPKFTHVGALQNVLDRGRREDVIAEDEEVRQTFLLGRQNGHRGRRRRGLKADGEEHHLAVGLRLGDSQRIQRRIDHAHVRAARLGLHQAEAACAGNAHDVAVGEQRDLWPASELDRAVDPSDRQNADRAARPVKSSAHAAGRRSSRPYLEIAWCAAAELHEMVNSLWPRFASDLIGDRTRQRSFTILVDIFHLKRPLTRPPRRPSATRSSCALLPDRSWPAHSRREARHNRRPERRRPAPWK